MIQNKTYTTRQAGRHCGVDLTTVINWVKSGKLKAYKTAGGHRRIEHKDLIEFMGKFAIPINPELRELTMLKVLLISTDPYIMPLIKMAVSGFYKDSALQTVSDPISFGFKLGVFKPDLVIIDAAVGGDIMSLASFVKRDYNEKTQIILLKKNMSEEVFDSYADIVSSWPLDSDEFIQTLKKLSEKD